MDNLCFFIGHRDTPESVIPSLSLAVEKHIVELGVTEFVVGNYGAFDRMAAKAVITAKQLHPEIMLTLLLPYHPSERRVEQPPGFDATFYPPDMETVPRRYAILRANRYMIDHADFLIAYAWHPGSNARDLVTHAMRKAAKGLIRVENLA